jgi:AcrR family transcriptional regulator
MKRVSGPKEENRHYHSLIRQQHAEETHQRILAAARELLVSQGYTGMTMEAIAEAAKVSPKTVFAVVGSKPEILAALVYPATFDATVQHFLEQLRTLEEPLQRIELVVLISRRIFEALASEFELLRTAGVVALELVDVARQVEMRRRKKESYLIGDLHKQGVLRQDLSTEEATDIIWSLTGFELYRMLVIERHWTAERYERWLTSLLIEHLIQPDDE